MLFWLQACCIGVLVTCTVTLSTITDIRFLNNAADDSENGEDRDRYRAVAWWLLAVAIVGIITQIILLVFRALFFKKIIISHFVIFGILVSIIVTYVTRYIIQKLNI